MKKIIGYAWVSIVGEALDPQREALERAGVDWLFVDVASPTAVKRRQLKRALLQLREGDTFVVCRLDRVGRNFRHLIELVQNLDSRGIGFRSLEENIDTTTAMGKLMLKVSWGALAKFGRDLREEAKARASGGRPGRKPKLDKEKRTLALTLYNDQGLSVEELCRKFEISPSTFFRQIRRGSKKKPGRKPKTKKTAVARRSTDRGRNVGKNAPEAIDNPRRRPALVAADSSSSHPVPARGIVSPRPAAVVPSRPVPSSTARA